ncbi:unnamed protein product [Symbiodinium sp. CCMP2456]|nr:unnamed protein product [Symbiodinium sp. CCMP2456]
MAALAKKCKIIEDLTKFLKERGGSVMSGDVGNFLIKHKEHREMLPDLRMFCEKHPQHLIISKPKSGPWKLSLNKTENEAVQKLAEFISSRGGLLRSHDFPDFKGQYPALAKVIYSGGRTLREFCQLHQNTFVVEASDADPSVCIRLMSQSSKQDKETVQALVKLLKESGGSIESAKLKDFRKEVPNLRAFCEQHPKRFAISPAIGGGWQLLLAPTEKEAAQRLAKFIASQSNSEINASSFGDFKKLDPAAAHVIRLDDQKLGEFCEKHATTFVVKITGTGLLIRLHSTAPKASDAKDKKVLADLGKFVKDAGNMISTEHLTEFCASHPEHKALLANPGPFCAIHKDHFVLLRNGPGWNLMSTSFEKNFVMKVVDFIRENGDLTSVPGDGVAQFIQHNPKFARVLNLGRETLRQICDRHGACVFEEISSIAGYCIRLHDRNRSEAVADLVQFMRGRHDAAANFAPNEWNEFFTKHPQHRVTVANTRTFCQKHSKHFHVWEGTGGQWRVQLASASTSRHVAANLAVFIQKRGKAVPVEHLSLFYGESPAYRQAISEAGGLKSFCSDHDRLLEFKTTASGSQIELACHCCYFFRGVCSHDSTHGKYLHVLPCTADALDDAVSCSYGPKCKFGHWEKVMQQAAIEQDRGSTSSSVTSPAGQEASAKPKPIQATKLAVSTGTAGTASAERSGQDPWADGLDPWSESLPTLSLTQPGGLGPSEEKPVPGSEAAGASNQQASPRQDPWSDGQDPWSSSLTKPYLAPAADLAAGLPAHEHERKTEQHVTTRIDAKYTDAPLPAQEQPDRQLENEGLSNDPWANGQDPWSRSLPGLVQPAPGPAEAKAGSHTEQPEGTVESAVAVHGKEGPRPDPWAEGRDPWSRSLAVECRNGSSDADPASTTHAECAAPSQHSPLSADEHGEPPLPHGEARALQSNGSCKLTEMRASRDSWCMEDVDDLPAAPAVSTSPLLLLPCANGRMELEGQSFPEDRWSRCLPASRMDSPKSCDEGSGPPQTTRGGEERHASEEGILAEHGKGSWVEQARAQRDLLETVVDGVDKEPQQVEEQRCVCELESLLSKLPEKLFTTMSAPQIAEVLHQAKVQRLVLQRGRPLQAALCSGWLPAHELPGATFTSQDLADVACQVTAAESPWRSGIFRIPGCLHRASFVYRGQELDAVNLHVSRLLPGLSNAVAPQLSSGSLLFLGPATSGKTSSLREAAASLAHTYQVVILDFHEELHSGDFDCVRSLVPLDSDAVAAVDRAIAEQSPEVIAAEFADVAAALQSAQLCSEAGVRLLCTLRGTVGGLTAAFARSSVPGSGTFPFDTVVVLRRQLDTWHVYAKSGASGSLGSPPSSAAQHSDSCAFLRQPRAVLRLKILGSPEGPSSPGSEGRMSATPSVHTLVSEPEEHGQI